MRKISTALLGALILAANALPAFSQEANRSVSPSDKYVISAKAGGVNFVAGVVGIVRKSGLSGRLIKGDSVEIGDRVSTAADGRAEVLLNPGSYLRLGSGSAFEFKSTSLDNLQIRLDRGSAVLEVFAGDGFTVTLSAPKAKFKLINSGVFRLDVDENGAGTLSVWKGRAQVGRTAAGIIKAGRTITISGGSVATAKFERGKGDSLDQWSKERGKELAKLSNSLRQRDLRQVLLSSYNGRQWNMYDSFGLWILDRSSGLYCFLPFGFGWFSPYGYGLNHNIGWYNLPWTVYNTLPTFGPGTRQPGQTNSPILSAGDRSPVPPFIKMQGGIINGRSNRSVFDGSIPPLTIPPIYSPPIRDKNYSLPSQVPTRTKNPEE